MPSVPQVVMHQVGGSYRSWDDPAIVASHSSFALTAQDATLTYDGGASAWLQTDFTAWATVAAAISAGVGFTESDVLGAGTLDMANTTDRFGATKRCLRFGLRDDEDLAYLQFNIPGATVGTSGSGELSVYQRWYEKRSSNYKFYADKSSRFNSKVGGSTYIDLLSAWGGSGGAATITQFFGQALVADDTWINSSQSWTNDTWKKFEVFIQLNTPYTSSNAIIRYWIDDVLVQEVTGFRILEGTPATGDGGIRDQRFQFIRIGGWESGHPGGNINGGAYEYRYYDDIYIGPSKP